MKEHRRNDSHDHIYTYSETCQAFCKDIFNVVYSIVAWANSVYKEEKSERERGGEGRIYRFYCSETANKDLNNTT